MFNNNTNYEEQDKDKKKRRLIAIILFAVAAIMIVSTVAAYFSDMLTDSGDLNTSDLKIEGTYSVFLNGNQTTLQEITNLNPGDVISLTATITNTGNQSAWLREMIVFAPYNQSFFTGFEVYEGAFTQDDFLNEVEGLDNFLLPISASGIAVGTNKVIDGSGENAQTESGIDYDYLESSTYNFALTIYFRHDAGNEAQDLNFTLTVVTQALQFRNNNNSVPSDTAWNNVVSA